MCFLQAAILQARSHRIPTAEAKKTAGFAAMVLKNPIELGDNAKISQDPTIPSYGYHPTLSFLRWLYFVAFPLQNR